MPPPAVVTVGLTKHFGALHAVERIDIELPTGVVSGFVGPNGAGKTTTIQMLLGLLRPTAGSARVLGQAIATPDAYLPRVGALIEAPTFYPTLSGARNLEVLARLGRIDRGRVARTLELVGLTERAHSQVRTYSLGMKQRLGVAAALLPDPELVILDEPTNGLDPAGTREMRTLLRELVDGGMTVFVSSHVLSEIETICDHLVLIDHGQILFQGSMAALLDAQHAELLATPEHARDAGPLAELCASAGKQARVDGELVHVVAGEDWAAELNRRAMAAGITLRGLQAKRASLEEAFFAITDRER